MPAATSIDPRELGGRSAAGGAARPAGGGPGGTPSGATPGSGGGHASGCDGGAAGGGQPAGPAGGWAGGGATGGAGGGAVARSSTIGGSGRTGGTGDAMPSTGIAASSRLIARCSPVIHGASGWLATPGDSAARPSMSAGTGISPVSSSGRYAPVLVASSPRAQRRPGRSATALSLSPRNSRARRRLASP